MSCIVLNTKGGSKSTIVVGESLESLGRLCPSNPVIITDSKVFELYGSRFPASLMVLKIGQGEAVKTLETVQGLYGRLLELGGDRSIFVLGIGGGIVCDVAGFVASTFLRGLKFGFAATTLLAQTDASVGGKNGVNFAGYKNMVGTFNQPEFVLCDTGLLATLPKSELANGFAEITKHGCIADEAYFDFLEQNASKAKDLDQEVINALVEGSVKIKAGVVSRDELEKGERTKLNFGHTFGHALEKVAGVSHGQAVAAGMVLAAKLSAARTGLAGKDVARIENLVCAMGLAPVINADRGRVVDALVKDKKRFGQSLRFVLLKKIGRSTVEEIPLDELADFYLSVTG
ncbi:MAG: 3-dehydroquinate synthase [Desulfatibacillaceae bacterium]|nr:3-dehydroquinate synthase [Desulfatibacillaceae bacterium]